MSIWRDIKKAWGLFWDARERAPQYTLFTHDLPEFPLPDRAPLPDQLPGIVIATPCKNTQAYLDTYFALIDALDYPKARIHLRILEGDSTDDTYAKADALLSERSHDYASTKLLKFDVGIDSGSGPRERVEIQRDRRSAIAECRNLLLQDAIRTDAEYVLFIDADMAVIPPEALRQALMYKAPILVANCLYYDKDKIFDRNAFRYTRPISDRSAKRYVNGGIYQPPTGYFRHYPDFRTPSEIEPLHAVGGTFLLIRRDVIEVGVDFPTEPYQLHLETEALALKAADHGFGAFMLPGLIVRHMPN